MPAPQPWDQRDGETARQYAAFTVFRDLGKDRSLYAVTQRLAEETAARRAEPGAKGGAKGRAPGAPGTQRGATEQPKGTSGRVRIWAKTHDWLARALAWDRHHAAIRDGAAARATLSEAEKAARDRADRDAESLASASQLRLKAGMMLRFPLTAAVSESRTVDPDGKTTVIHQSIEPARWSFRDAAAMLKVARELEADVFGAAPAPTPVTHTVMIDPATAEEGFRRVRELKARHREALLAAPTGPPGPGENPGPGRGAGANGTAEREGGLNGDGHHQSD